MKLSQSNGPKPAHSHYKNQAAAIRLFISGMVMAVSSVVLLLCSRMVPGFARTYSRTVYPLLADTLGRFSGLFPFSLSEAGLYLTGIFCITGILFMFRKPIISLARMFFFTCLLLFLFTVNCGVNYYRPPFSYEAGMVMEPSSPKELYDLCSLLITQVNGSLEEAENLGASPDGLYPAETADMPRLSAAALRELGLEAVASMHRLGDTYPQLGGFYPYPKPLINSRLLSVQQLCGIYSPFTIEANYNREMPYYNIPHTVCHELSHLKGYMREDEANFIGYLACIDSQSPYFRYSGYLMGWVYAGNALAKVDLNAYHELYGRLSPKAVRDLRWNDRFWDRYDGKVAEASNRLNDRYLKANNQNEGVKSYGHVVDLMLAYYKDSL